MSQHRQKAGTVVFSALFALESLVRSLNVTIISLQSYDLLGSGQRVSMMATGLSVSVLITTLCLPLLLGRLPRRWAYSLGVVAMIVASLSLASYSVAGLAFGIYIRNCGVAIVGIVLSLYIMEHIHRSQLARNESVRLTASTVSWVAGPATGAWVYAHYGPVPAQALVIGCAMTLLSLFWFLRLPEKRPAPALRPIKVNALKNIRRFIAQPRLRLAWLIAFGRSCFWITLFIYGPIMLVQAGLPKTWGGLLISASQVTLLLAYFYGKMAMRVGVRPVISVSLGIMAIACFCAGVSGLLHPYMAMAFLLWAATATAGLDSVGGVPYLRAVKPRERQQMTAVYRTFIELSDLLPAVIYAIALSFFSINVVFVILSLLLAGVAGVSYRYLPKSL